ncbi:hypothetical protein N5D77_16875 [Comamonas thiooxydans]|uniref:Uncharacterized protein n=1 Tax=Comamonas thiooxydans TaxID=363952 RepID=A0AA42PXU8_9BURK|nr:hypothetical protein [Comamonas thiooxydans]MDH1333505.1 hypothetical protein [Comamonas thiooxydans]MDH1788244.1 hypothetical protein [Comamonas thiooxydans]
MGNISIQQFVEALAKASPSLAPARMNAPAALRPAPAPMLREEYRDLTPEACRKRLRKVQDEMVKDVTKGRFSDVESREWHALPEKYRAILLLISGFQADDYEQLGAVATRAWQEFTPPERQAVKSEMRGLHAAVQHINALRRGT